MNNLLDMTSQGDAAQEEGHQTENQARCRASVQDAQEQFWREMPRYGVHAARRVRKYWGEPTEGRSG